MKHIELGCLLAGTLLIVMSVALIFWPLAPGIAGAFLLAAGLDLGR